MQDEHISSGLISFIDGNYKTALESFNKGLEKESNTEALVYRGISYLKLGSYDQAISDFNEAEKTADDQFKFEIPFNRGLAYLYNSEISFAKKDLETAKAHASDSQLVQLNKYLTKLQ